MNSYFGLYLKQFTCLYKLFSRAMANRARGPYARHNKADRLRIIRHAEEGLNWRELAETLGIKYHTAYTWVTNMDDHDQPRPRGGSAKKLSAVEIDGLCEIVENDPALTLSQIAEILFVGLGILLSASTVHNYLVGRLITLKKSHQIVETMNSADNKLKRRQYVEQVSGYMRQSKYIIWMDETNLNLYCRRSQARALAGQRAAIALPASKGPNIHVIGCISAYQVIRMTRVRGSFKAATCKEWVLDMLDHHLPQGVSVQSVVLVCDNAPCHSSLNQCEEERPGLIVLHLGPYSPMLNPIENIWQKIKSNVKRHMRPPVVVPPGVGEQRLVYVENLIDNAIPIIGVQDCVNCWQHSQGFFQAVLNNEDMSVGI